MAQPDEGRLAILIEVINENLVHHREDCALECMRMLRDLDCVGCHSVRIRQAGAAIVEGCWISM